jgi:D-glycero-alpha-D-manno-heptose-7-phosphate kinase
MQERQPKANWLAEKAVEIERKRLGEIGGLQDQYFAAFGGARLFEFGKNGVKVSAELPSKCLETLSNSLVLVPVGVSRNSSSYASVTALSSQSHYAIINEMACLARDTYNEFCDLKGSDLGVEKLGQAMRYSWELKKIVSNQSENERVNTLINRGISLGAYGGKLCGAGGSGFILFIVDPGYKTDFISRFNNEGAQEIAIAEHGSKSYRLEQN